VTESDRLELRRRIDAAVRERSATTRWCPRCSRELDLESFTNARACWCASCCAIERRSRREQHILYMREYRRRQKCLA
jgi:hypothetical protein